MNQQPDKFFRDKLDRYQKPAPAGAWNKLEAGLAKKNNKPVPWLAIAASLLLLAAATSLFWPEKQNPGQPARPTAQQKSTAPDTTPEKDIQPQRDLSVVAPKTSDEQEKIVPSHNPPPKEKERIKPAAPAEEITVAHTPEEEPVVTVPEEPSEAVKSSAEQPVVASATPSTEQPGDPTIRDQNMKLVFSAAESEEYLDKKSLAEATSSGKKSSTLKKLLKKAEDLKTNQDPFGELRQKKNEILALNFKTDKQRGQNK